MKIDSHNSTAEMLQFYEANIRHATFVSQLADQIFSDLFTLHGLNESKRAVLCTAATLHDIGRYYGKADHHKHSHFIIMHDPRTADWSAKFRKTAALIALNHRTRHESGLEKYKPSMIRMLRSLCAILRIADVLDREHEQQARWLKSSYDRRKRLLTVHIEGIDLSALKKPLIRKTIWAVQAWKVTIQFTGSTGTVTVLPKCR